MGFLGSTTLIFTVAVRPLTLVLAVMTALPSPTAATVPSWDTLATLLFWEEKVTSDTAVAGDRV